IHDAAAVGARAVQAVQDGTVTTVDGNVVPLGHDCDVLLLHGDHPLVLLTALGGPYDSNPYTSRWIDRPRPYLTEDGLYEDRPDGAPIRVFTWIDVRLMFEDFYAKLQLHVEG
ncbi:MAG TPA: hypothetical protein PLG38_02900, partial [Propionibacteriaceae bacterium]|nr:hypothetical protein [Propionibacteriaceae bacterium]